MFVCTTFSSEGIRSCTVLVHEESGNAAWDGVGEFGARVDVVSGVICLNGNALCERTRALGETLKGKDRGVVVEDDALLVGVAGSTTAGAAWIEADIATRNALRDVGVGGVIVRDTEMCGVSLAGERREVHISADVCGGVDAVLVAARRVPGHALVVRGVGVVLCRTRRRAAQGVWVVHL